MPRAVSLPQRQKIWERAQQGHSPSDIATDLGLKPDTVRRLIARFRKLGADGLRPGYDRCGKRSNPAAPSPMIAAAETLRRQHASWGGGIIRVVLAETHPGAVLPSVRTLQRHFRRCGLAPAPPGRRRLSANHRRAQEPHQVWQMDAAEQVALRTGQQVSWLRIADEASGAVLKTEVFPPRALEQRAGWGDSDGVAAGLRALGHARCDPGGQRHSLGLAWRLADGPGVVAGWPGSAGVGQPAGSAPG